MDHDRTGPGPSRQPTYQELLERVARFEQQQELSLRRILDNLVEGCAVLSPDWIYLYVNKVNAQHAHLTPEQMVGRNMLELIPGVEKSPFFDAYRRCMEERTPQQVESRFAFADGSSAWYEAKAEPVHEGIFVLSQDITARKLAEEQARGLLDTIREERDRYSALVASMGDEVWFADKEKRFTLINPSGSREFGLASSPERPLVEDLAASLEVLRPDGSPRPIDEAPPLRALRGEVVRNQEELIRTPVTGRMRYRQVNASPVRDARGAIVGSVSVVRDITERKQAEEAVRQSQQTFSDLVERAPFGIYVVDSQFRIAHMNVSSQAGAFRNVRPAIGRDFAEAMHILWPEAVAAGIIAAFRHTLDTGESYYAPRFTNPRHDLETVESYEWQLHRITLPDGQRGVICYYFDSTELREAEEALRDANARLTEADRRKDEFLGMLSHELRNPLMPIQNSLYIMEHAARGGEQANQAQAVIRRQVEHLTRLVDDLLDVTRIARGKIHLQRARIELNDVIARTIEDHRCAFAEHEIDLQLQAGTRPLAVNADATRVAQLVGNLLQNALKFTDRGGRTTVAVNEDEERRQAVVRVSDTGAGIPTEMLRQLFEPFMQADHTLDRSRGGLGLGLALVKGLVELHGGDVSAHSNGLGQGAEFTVRLPLDEAPDARPGGGRGPVLAGPHRRGLGIGDNVDAADSLRVLLELDGHYVAVAYSGPEGIARARNFQPQVVLCDIGLPGMDGYGVARAFRAEDALRGALLVALSGYASPEDIAKATEAGFDCHLAKPPNLEKIRELLALGAKPTPD
jgi:PAS domain S-box-containing protein